MISVLIIILLLITFQRSIMSVYQTKNIHNRRKTYYVSINDIDTNDNSRVVEMNNYSKRNKRRNEMPLSQSWYRHRQQYISKNQKRSYNTLWPIYGIHLYYNRTINAKDIFCNNDTNNKELDKYTILDIGFGNGDSIIGMAKENLNINYIGCEIHKAGIASTLLIINQSSINNIRLIRSDVTILFESHLLSYSFNEICVFFPDPWPNTIRDSERRVIRPYMLSLFANKLKDNGILHIATDVEDYAKYIEEVILQFNQYYSNHSNYIIINNNPPTITANKQDSNNRIEINDINNKEILDTSYQYPTNELTTSVATTTTNTTTENATNNSNDNIYDNNKVTLLQYSWNLLNKSIHEAGSNGPIWRPITKYERKAATEGRLVWEFSYQIQRYYHTL